MDKRRVADFINAYCSANKIKNDNYDYQTMLNELIINMVDHYTKRGIKSVPAQQDDFPKYIIKPNQQGEYSLEDFFLNRLFFNVEKVTPHSSVKGDYEAPTRVVNLNFEKIEDQFKHIPILQTPDKQGLRDVATKKVIMHEFEHALQTQFPVKASSPRYYEEIAEELSQMNNGAYASSIQDLSKTNHSTNTLPNALHIGLYAPSDSPIASKVFRTGSGSSNEAHHNMNEIMNESESLIMAGAKAQTQVSWKSGSGNYYKKYNSESSNGSITQFGFLLKEVLGAKASFEGMYLDPAKMMTDFNTQYDDIFAQSFGEGQSAWEHLQTAIAEIKATGKEDDYLKLSETLARCLEKRISSELGTTPPDELMHSIIMFRNHSITNDDKDKRAELPHFKILKDIKGRIDEQKRVISQEPVQTEPQPALKSSEGFQEASKTEFDEANRLFRHILNYTAVRDNETNEFDLVANYKITKSDLQQGKHVYYVDIELFEKTYNDFTTFLESKGLKADFDNMVKTGTFSHSKPIIKQQIKQQQTPAQSQINSQQALQDLISTTPQEFLDAGITKGDYVKLNEQKAKAKANWVSNFMNDYSQVDNRTIDENGNTVASEVEFYEKQVIEMIRQNRGTPQAMNFMSGTSHCIMDDEKPKKDADGKLMMETHYSIKQIGEMGELLKAAQRLKEKTGEDYLEAFSNVAQVDYWLREIKKDTSGDMARMRQEAQRKLQGNS